jgi:Plant transposon protein
LRSRPSNRKAQAFAKWQEASRKVIEPAFGVLQRKFHILVKKTEMWYVGDIACVVNTSIMLYNMMVSHRINNDEVKSEAVYVYDGCLENDERNIAPAAGLEAEQQHVD